LFQPETCVYAQYTIEVLQRSHVQEYLKNHHIPTAVHYPIPLHLQPVFADDYQQVHFPIAEMVAKSVMSLPMHPYLSEDDQDYIVNHLISALTHCQEQVA
jgi:UDP-2-acetamido-2-deoxy-ribo-hexuluronate aminotransferase